MPSVTDGAQFRRCVRDFVPTYYYPLQQAICSHQTPSSVTRCSDSHTGFSVASRHLTVSPQISWKEFVSELHNECNWNVISKFIELGVLAIIQVKTQLTTLDNCLDVSLLMHFQKCFGIPCSEHSHIVPHHKFQQCTGSPVQS